MIWKAFSTFSRSLSLFQFQFTLSFRALFLSRQINHPSKWKKLQHHKMYLKSKKMKWNWFVEQMKNIKNSYERRKNLLSSIQIEFTFFEKIDISLSWHTDFDFDFNFSFDLEIFILVEKFVRLWNLLLLFCDIEVCITLTIRLSESIFRSINRNELKQMRFTAKVRPKADKVTLLNQYVYIIASTWDC